MGCKLEAVLLLELLITLDAASCWLDLARCREIPAWFYLRGFRQRISRPGESRELRGVQRAGCSEDTVDGDTAVGAWRDLGSPFSSLTPHLWVLWGPGVLVSVPGLVSAGPGGPSPQDSCQWALTSGLCSGAVI